ncbi:MAG: hypothetical protein JW931_02290 [Methanomicrobiaceae archaeon]|nr:hypothetical protein [Methanomicrobiaceae archaeon]
MVMTVLSGGCSGPGPGETLFLDEIYGDTHTETPGDSGGGDLESLPDDIDRIPDDVEKIEDSRE